MILHTEITGSGEPIVFLHTGLQTGTTDFEAQTAYFKQNYQVIQPDLRGHGKSISNEFTNFFRDSADDLTETLAYLGIDAAHVIGCSIGALVGLAFAKNYPDQVKSLTLSGVIAEKPSNWERFVSEDVEHQTKLLEDKETVAFFDNTHKSDWRKLLKMSQNSEWYPFKETSDLSMLDLPVLFIVGEGHTHETIGAVTYPKMNENIHVCIIPFASHLVQAEQPEIYTKAVEVFLKKVENET